MRCFERRHCEKLCCERTSQFYICVYIQCRRRRPTILSFLFPAETDVLVPVFSQSTDVVVVNFVVVLRFPINHFSWLRKIFWLEVNRLWHGYRLTTRLRALLNNSTANLKFYWSNTLWYSQIKWQLACKANVSVWFRSKQRGTRPLPNPTLFWMYF